MSQQHQTPLGTARDLESARLDRCLQVAAGAAPPPPIGQADANVFRLMGMAVRSSFPLAARRLHDAAEGYFLDRPDERLEAEDVIRCGWLIGLPRFRDMLEQRLRQSGLGSPGRLATQ